MRIFIQALLAAAISSIPLLMANSEDWAIVYGLAVLGCTAASLILPTARFSAGTLLEVLALLGLLLTPILISVVFNEVEEVRVENIAMLLFYAILGVCLLDPEQPASYTAFFALVAVGHALVVPIIWSETAVISLTDIGAMLEERRAAFDLEDIELNPNYLGMMGLIVAMAAVAMPSLKIRVALALYGVFIAWLMSSRTSILTIAFAGLAYLLCHVREKAYRHPSEARNAALLLAAVSVAVALLAYTMRDFLFEDVLLVDDEYRGIGTGFSDRWSLWEAAFDLWTENMLIGVGYGQHVARMGLGIYAHNMVLVLLSEMGVIGLVCFTLFSALCLRNGFRLLRLGHRVPAICIITIIIAYWVYGVFEGKAVSAGTPISAIFFLLCFSSAGSRIAEKVNDCLDISTSDSVGVRDSSHAGRKPATALRRIDQ